MFGDIVLAIKALYILSGFQRLFSSWQSRRQGEANQRAADETALAKVNKAEAQAAAEGPLTRSELETTLGEGKL